MTDGTQICVTADLVGGTASCQITEEADGPFSFSGTYGGDTNYLASGPSAGFNVTIGGADTTTSITSTTPSPVVGSTPTTSATS